MDSHVIDHGAIHVKNHSYAVVGIHCGKVETFRIGRILLTLSNLAHTLNLGLMQYP